MVSDEKADLHEIMGRIFDIKDEPMPRGAWWWWFWLFFFDNPNDPARPRQLMILWSTKNVREIECNGLRIRLGEQADRSRLDGAVAAWYFDGREMHHNFLLEQCGISVSGNGLSTDSGTPTTFAIDGERSTVRIGDDFEFVADTGGRHDFAMPTHHRRNIIGSKGYSIIRLNHLDLHGRAQGKPVRGSAYFQRVFVNAPSPSWYWGVFHFDKGGILTYFNPRFLGKSVKKDITLFDGGRMHEFRDIRVVRRGGKMPVFDVSGKDGEKRISFTVEPYSHSSWTFRKRSLGIIPNKLVYNEYPATITDLSLTDGKAGDAISLRDLGRSVGNAEHTTGLLL